MVEPIEITIQPRLGEHIRAERLYYRKRSKFAKIDKLVALILVAVSICGLAAGGGFRGWTLLLLIAAPLEFFNLLSIAPLVTRFRFNGNPKFSGVNILKFEDHQISYHAPSIQSKLSWDIYTDMIEDDRLILLIYGGNMYSILPKRCFRDSQTLNAFRSMVLEKLIPTNASAYTQKTNN